MSIAMTICAWRPVMSVELMARLKALKLHGMAQCWPELMAKARHSDLPPESLDERVAGGRIGGA